MDESTPIRAIVIGVSVLIGIATISAVLMYYNTAKQMASNVGRGQDFASNYEQSIQDILLKGSYTVSGNNYITGTDVKNLINYFYNSENVIIEIKDMKNIAKYENNTSIANQNSGWAPNVNQVETLYNVVMKDILDNQKFKLTKTDNFQFNGKSVTKLVVEGQI